MELKSKVEKLNTKSGECREWQLELEKQLILLRKARA
jgi:hypothetical protein